MENENLIKEMVELYNKSSDAIEWAAENEPDPDLYYKGGVQSQSRRFTALGTICSIANPPHVVSYHTSKSVRLPVAMFNLDFYRNCHAVVLVRDNFYDIKVAVISHVPIKIPYEIIHRRVTQEWYNNEKQKALSWGSEKDEEELKNFETDEWYTKNWSGGYILRRNDEIWIAGGVQSVYCEGINKVLDSYVTPEYEESIYKPYVDNLTKFTISLGSYSTAAMVFDYIQASLGHGQAEFSRELNASE